MVLISACLAGINCRHDGGNKGRAEFITAAENEQMITFCPEIKRGVPRDPCEIIGGDGNDVLDGSAKVVTITGADVTSVYLSAAYDTLELCRTNGVGEAWLKSNSPSCGKGVIYDGTFSGTKITGDGVTTALLQRNGITVKSF